MISSAVPAALYDSEMIGSCTFDPSISAWASVISDAPPPGTRRGSW